MLEVRILGTHPKATQSESLGGGRGGVVGCPAICVLQGFQMILKHAKMWEAPIQTVARE